MTTAAEAPNFTLEVIETEQNCPSCEQPLTITKIRDAICNRKKCHVRLYDMNGTWVMRKVWFDEYIMPMMEETLPENAGA
jgi:Zn finger protein HypA/HybF involved in hydrogenase expression